MVLAIRERRPGLPVIVLNVCAEVSDRLRALDDAGARDYLAKPFAYDELVARVHAHLRRSTAT